MGILDGFTPEQIKQIKEELSARGESGQRVCTKRHR